MKQSLSYISFCPLRILYNSKFIIMEKSLGTNAVIVTRVHCTFRRKKNGPRQAKMCYRACAKCADSHQLAMSHPGFCSSLIYIIVSNDPFSGQ